MQSADTPLVFGAHKLGEDRSYGNYKRLLRHKSYIIRLWFGLYK